MSIKNIDLQSITRIICSPCGKAGKTGRTVAVEIEPAYVHDKSEGIAFEYNGATLFEQTGWNLEKYDLQRWVMKSDEVKMTSEKTVDGERFENEDMELKVIGDPYRGEIKFALPKEYRIFGLGQHEDGTYDYRGKKEFLVQNNMKIPMPVFMCVGKGSAFAVYFDAGCLMTFEESGGTAAIHFDAARKIDYYVIAGKNLDEVSRELRKLTGTAVMLPRWAFGYVQSREHYKNQGEVLEIAKTFREKGIPLSCIVQDWNTWEKGKWGNKIMDKTRYHSAKAMLDELHANDVAFMVSIWPNPRYGSEDNAELLEVGGMLANASTYDAFNEKAREVYWMQCERDWFSAGADAWWCDSTEPFTPDWGGKNKLSGQERYDGSKEQLAKFLDGREANDYALVHAQGIYENQRKACKTKRVVNLTRSGSPSIQRYGAVLWSGDVAATWRVMRDQIAEGLNISAAGIPYWTTDIGAFFVGSDNSWIRWKGGDNPGPTPWFWCGDYEDGNKDLGYRELYVRWFQWGTFLPMMRSHGTDTPREPWFFDDSVNPANVGDGVLDVPNKYYNTIIKYINLRYKLLPYVYSLAGMTNRENYTMMRNLAFDFAHDDTACGVADQYMFGPAFLVCPVTTPMEFESGSSSINNSREREVYLPEGNWFDYETKQYIEGGKKITANAPVENMPLYVKAGSVVPVSGLTTPPFGHPSKEGNCDALEVYAGCNATFTLYLDNGKDYAYEHGEFAAVTFEWNEAAKTLRIAKKEGNYAVPESLRYTVYNIDGTTAEGEVNL